MMQQHSLRTGFRSVRVSGLTAFAVAMLLCGHVLLCDHALAEEPAAKAEVAATDAAASNTPSAADNEFFESRIRPVLAEHCWSCHGPDQQKAGLRLDSAAAMTAGAETGPVIETDQLDASPLLEAVEYTGLYKMPPRGKLPEAAIADIRRWVSSGAKWPATPSGENPAPASNGDRSKTSSEFNLAERKAAQWAFQPLHVVSPPEEPGSNWVRTPEDRFILAKLTAAGLQPSPPIDASGWLRRVTFDLTGRPPLVSEIRAFLSDRSSTAREAVVDRLLSSPEYGERQARHWLDLVRYAESHGHEFDFDVPYAFEYRDYVIRAMNADLPYNQFVVEHLAGDLLPEPRRNPDEGFNESVLATGFWYMHEALHSPVDVRADEAARIDNQIDVFGKAFLSMTLACARCHDHKFDAISTADYYAMSGYLQSSRYNITCVDSPEVRQPVITELQRLQSTANGLVELAAARVAEDAADEVANRFLRFDPGANKLVANARETGNATIAGAAVQAVVPGGALPASTPTNEPVAAQNASDTAWQQAIDQLANEDATSPLHVWARWCRAQRNGEFGSATRDAAWAAFRNRWPAWNETPTVPATSNATDNPSGSVDAARAAEYRLVDFAAEGFQNWYVDGDAFGSTPILPMEHLDLVANGPTRSPIAPHRVASSGAISKKLRGTLRSPTFEITAPTLSFWAAGERARVRIILDGLQLIQDPIYGGLSLQIASPHHLQWYQRDVSKWVGHRAYLEFVDDGDGWIAVGRVDMGPGTTEHAEVSGLNSVLRSLPQAANESPESYAKWLAAEWHAAHHNLASRSASTAQSDATQTAAANSAAALKTAHQQLLTWSLSCSAPGTLGDLLSQPAVSGSVEPGSVGSVPVQAASKHSLTELQKQFAECESKIAYKRMALTMADGTGENERVFLRGSHKRLGPVATRQLPVAVGGDSQPAPAVGSGRLELARRLVNERADLLLRVIVNRVWKQHFGQGLVRSTDDFGNMGEAPSHPELLDSLAVRFREDGWSLKRLHRRLVLSAAYAMSSELQNPAAELRDPQNRLLHRQNLKRLEAESIRDAILTVSGRLNTQMYGRSVPVNLTPFMVGRGRPAESGPLDGDGRRSIYLAVRRNFLNPFFLAFDFPVPFSANGRRNMSNVPAQALSMMNNPFVRQQAEFWAARIDRSPGEIDSKVREMYLAAFGREPDLDEVAAAVSFLLERREGEIAENQPTEQRWGELAHVLFNVKEFIFVR